MSKVIEVKVSKEDEDIRIDRWFKRHFPNISHGSVEKALRKGQIRVNKEKVKSSHRIKTEDIIRVPPLKESNKEQEQEKEKEQKPKKEISEKYRQLILDSIIFKNDDIIVINKPAGIASQGGIGITVSIDDLLRLLKFDYKEKPKLVHRLDKDTSGVMIIARNTSQASKLTKEFKDKSIQKTYLALIVGIPEVDSGKIDLPITKLTKGAGKELMTVDEKNGQKAITHFRVIEKIGKKLCLVELQPITGRTHQLRVHMSYIGHPILGDGKYGGQSAFIDGLSKKMHLHAREIKLQSYNKPFTASINGSMQETFDKLGIVI